MEFDCRKESATPNSPIVRYYAAISSQSANRTQTSACSCGHSWQACRRNTLSNDVPPAAAHKNKKSGESGLPDKRPPLEILR